MSLYSVYVYLLLPSHSPEGMSCPPTRLHPHPLGRWRWRCRSRWFSCNIRRRIVSLSFQHNMCVICVCWFSETWTTYFHSKGSGESAAKKQLASYVYTSPIFLEKGQRGCPATLPTQWSVPAITDHLRWMATHCGRTWPLYHARTRYAPVLSLYQRPYLHVGASFTAVTLVCIHVLSYGQLRVATARRGRQWSDPMCFVEVRLKMVVERSKDQNIFLSHRY